MPERAARMLVHTCEPKVGTHPEATIGCSSTNSLEQNFENCNLVFSALDTGIATSVEKVNHSIRSIPCSDSAIGQIFADRMPVFSNASSHRMEPTGAANSKNSCLTQISSCAVPILLPYVNASHLTPEVLAAQRKALGFGRGFIVTNANCSTTGLVVALKPLHDAFGLRKVLVTTMQAVSGAGKSLDRAQQFGCITCVLFSLRVPWCSIAGHPRQYDSIHQVSAFITSLVICASRVQQRGAQNRDRSCENAGLL